MSRPSDLFDRMLREQALDAERWSDPVSEVTQPAGDEPEAPQGPLVPDSSEPADPVAPDEPATVIDPTPEREVPEPAAPVVEPQPDPPVRSV